MKLLEQLGQIGKELLVRKDGPLTRDLLLEPAKHGLGRVPGKLSPDQTTTMVCGFCSTGCGLNILLKSGEAVGLVPTTKYPVNLGMACPKGWEALTPLAGPGRGSKPLVRRNGKMVEVEWEDAIFEMVDRFKAIQEKHGSKCWLWILALVVVAALAWMLFSGDDADEVDTAPAAQTGMMVPAPAPAPMAALRAA